MATPARSMPPFGLLAILIWLALQLPSDRFTPLDSRPDVVRIALMAAPTTYFVACGQVS